MEFLRQKSCFRSKALNEILIWTQVSEIILINHGPTLEGPYIFLFERFKTQKRNFA